MVFYEMALPCQLSISLLFWTFIYPDGIIDWVPDLQPFQKYLIYCSHSLPALLVLADFVLGSILFKLSNCLFLSIYLIMYYIGSYLYIRISGQDIYKYVDFTWGDLKSLYMVLIHFILTMFLFYLLNLISNCRKSKLI